MNNCARPIGSSRPRVKRAASNARKGNPAEIAASAPAPNVSNRRGVRVGGERRRASKLKLGKRTMFIRIFALAIFATSLVATANPIHTIVDWQIG